MRPDACIEDAFPTLPNPEEYVRGILESSVSEKFNRDEAVVRIGTSGKGVQPHYSIEEGEGSHTCTLPNGMTMRGYRHRAVFHGRSHKPILEDEFKGKSWSSSTATYADVHSILGPLGPRRGSTNAAGPKGQNRPADAG
jgi:hypothetical protein